MDTCNVNPCTRPQPRTAKALGVIVCFIMAAGFACADDGALSQAYYESKVKEIQKSLETINAPRPKETPKSQTTKKQKESPSESTTTRKRGIRVFVNEDGVATLTNRPDHYRSKGYKEQFIEFDPIVIPDRYKKYTKPEQYASEDIKELVKQYCAKWKLEENLIHAVIKAESNYNVNAISPAGACGLMQVMPCTAEEMGVTKLFDPAQNIAAGTQYLRKMLDLFKQDKRLALAAYNAGPETVKKYGGIPPYPETVAYVRNVLGYTGQYSSSDIQHLLLAKASTKESPKTQTRDRKFYTVYFKSGYSQPAEKVIDQDPYYCLQFRGRMYSIRKDTVEKIVKPA